MRAKKNFLSLIYVVFALSFSEHVQAADYRFKSCLDAFSADEEAEKHVTTQIEIRRHFNFLGLGPWETEYKLGLNGPWMLWAPRNEDAYASTSNWGIFRLHHFWERDSSYGDNYLITGVPCFLGEDFPLYEGRARARTVLFQVTTNRVYKDHNHADITEILTLWHPLIDGQVIFGIRHADPGEFLFRKLRDHCRVHCTSPLSDFFKYYKRPQ